MAGNLPIAAAGLCLHPISRFDPKQSSGFGLLQDKNHQDIATRLAISALYHGRLHFA